MRFLARLAIPAMLVAAACGKPPAPVPAPAAPTLAYPAADELRRDLFVFASDSFRGRETGTPDELRAVRFLAARVAALGLTPAGDSGFVQHVPLSRTIYASESSVTVSGTGASTTLRVPDDIVAITALGPGIYTKLQASGDLVYAGYGLPVPATGRDDLAGLDLRGKIVVVVNGAPAGSDSVTRAQLEAPAAIGARLQRILPMGPAALIILTAPGNPTLFDELKSELAAPVTLRDTTPLPTDAQRQLPMILVGHAEAGSPLLPANWPQNDSPQRLGRQFSARLLLQRQNITAFNVVARVVGRDPALRNTYVAYGAHLDHLGMVRPPEKGDSVANGADDDGSGSVTLLALARAFQQGPHPRRSVLFVWHTGEEKGLLGSSWFTTHPTVPIDSIVAQLNADMIGRNGADSLYVVGPIAAPNYQSRRLGAIADSVNAHEPRPFVFDREWDSPSHPEQIYYRSDHYNYARHGVPILFFTTGLHPDYHQPSDEPNKIDYDKMARVARLFYDLGYAVAESGVRPR